MSLFRPPVLRAAALTASATLDKALFSKTFEIAAAQVNDNRLITKYQKALTASKEILRVERIPSVADVPETASPAGASTSEAAPAKPPPRRKCLLLRPGIVPAAPETWSDVIRQGIEKKELGAPFSYQLTLHYDHWTSREVLVSVLPEEFHDDIPTGFNTAGHVAHLNLRDRFKPWKHVVAQVLLDKNPQLRTVINKTDLVGTESAFRTFPYEVLAGPDDMNVEVRENACIFRFDYSKVYWNSKLEPEHTRLVYLFKPGEAVVDLMSGIGPFAVPAGKRGVFVWANDMNPDSYVALRDAIDRNKAAPYVRPFNEDGLAFIHRSADLVRQAAEANEGALDVADTKRPGAKPAQPPPQPAKGGSRERRPAPAPRRHVPIPPTISHFVMNLPASAITFLPRFRGLYAGHESLFRPVAGEPRAAEAWPRLPMVHTHCFAPKDDDLRIPHGDVCARVSAELGVQMTLCQTYADVEADDPLADEPKHLLYVHNVRAVAPLGPAMVVHERVGSLSVSEHDDEKPVPLLVQRWQQHTAHITVTRDDVGSCVEEAVGDHPGEPEINNTDGIQELPPHAWMVPTMATERNHHTKPPAPTTTPSGRRKRAPSMTARAFFSLTHAQAVRRKWLYAGVLYAGIAVTILGILRPYIGAYALRGREPFGWALGYLLGGFDGFRLEVVKANLEHWVCLPPRPPPTLDACLHCHAGWVEHVRQTWLGAATTRLVLFGYWGLVIVFGLTVVFTLSPIYEVDTRRKVFHFMMVAVLLPATFVDPAFAGLALALVLSVFLLLDLLRASQLPPLSRPIATFLTPYVDGRDLRGPVVISHIFLLIGCAIPLWLSLASLPRTFSSSGSDDCTTGWEVPTRDVSMVAGVICVGLGDAAASLIGRRWGRRKWVWGGGKSLEGSVAFATAVFAGTMAASLWLRVGGWPVTGEDVVPLPLASDMTAGSLDRTVAWIGGRAAQAVAPRAGVCAVVASLTEAVLTGGNDNVVVPVILWTCVKSFGL